MADDRSFGAGDDFDIAPFEFIDPIKWQGAPVPERRWLVDQWVPLHSVTMLSGDGGVGKSTMALQLAVCCATGRDFLGLPTMGCKTAYICCEDDPDELQRRLAAITKSLDLDMADLIDLSLVSRVGQNNVLMTFQADGQGQTSAIYQQIMRVRDFGAQLIVLDNAADFYAGNENIRTQVRQFISMLTRIALDIDGAVLLLFHPSLTGRNSGTGESGSTGWSNSARSRLYLAMPEKNQAPDDRDARVLTRQKSNYSRAGEKISLRYSDGAFVNYGEPQLTGHWPPERRKQAEAAFLAGLQELRAKEIRVNIYKGQGNYAPTKLAEIANSAEGFDEAELKAAMDRLIKSGKVKSTREGPRSRQRSFLEIIEPAFPGLDQNPNRDVNL